MNVTKRDGSVVEFDRNKITIAIKKALEACDMASDTIALSVTEDVVQAIGDVPEINQESVLDLVQEALMKRGLLKVATAFIRYRERHAMARSSNIELINGFMDKLSARHIRKDNANVDEESFDGREGEAVAYMEKRVALDFKMSDIAKYNHENNLIYWHDLSKAYIGSHNCLSVPFESLLRKGFMTRQTGIRGANSVSTAFQQLAVIFQIQSLQQFGGVASTSTDYQMVPYVRKSLKKHYLKRALEDYTMDRDMMDVEASEEMKALLWKHPVKTAWRSLKKAERRAIKQAFNKWFMDVKGLTDTDFTFASITLDPTRKSLAIADTRDEAEQAVEGMMHNLNSLQSRSSGQLPFTSINYGTCVEEEGRMITELLLEGIIEGNGYNHSTPIFPCGIFVVKEGINKHPGDPNYDLFQLALAATSQRLYPNYANGDWSTQKAWFKYDREMKADVINNLSEEDKTKLRVILEAKPDLAKKLSLKADLSIDWEEMPYEQMSTMGCFFGSTIIEYKVDGVVRKSTFEVAWDTLSKRYPVKLQPNGVDWYIDTPGVQIFDAVVHDYVDQYRIIKNHSKDWINIRFSNGVTWRVTPDHPCCVFETENAKEDTRTAAKDLKLGARMAAMAPDGFVPDWVFVEALERKTEEAFSYDVTTKSDYFMADYICSHNCRTMNGADINARECYEKAIKQVIEIGDTDVDLLSAIQKDGRGNICPVTIILPELAMIANKDPEVFLQVLEQKINEAMDSLIERFSWIASQPAASAKFMYQNHTMAGYVPEEGIISALKHGTLAIGQLGLAEALQLLIGKDHTTPEGMELAKRIEQLFKDKCAAFKQEYKLNVAVYMTPAESLAYTACKKFQAKYGKIPNVSDREYFTNSIHVPVTKRMNPFEKIDIESQLTGYSSGGCITYVELDVSVKNNLEALEKLVVYAMDKDIPYFAINVPNDQCQSCGYIGDVPGDCPKCGSNQVMRLRRVTGYLSTTYEHFNPGKQDEVLHRVKHIG